MKLLIISPTPTHPTISGNRARVLTVVNALKALGHDLHFAWIPMTNGDEAAMQALFGPGRFHRLKYGRIWARDGLPPRTLRTVRECLSLESAYMWGLDDYFDPTSLPLLRALHARERFEAVCVEYVFMSRAFEVFGPEVFKVLDTHDQFALRHRKFLEAGQVPQWFSTSEAEETRGFLRADHVLAIQDAEAEIFRRQLEGRRPVSTLGHMLELPEIPMQRPDNRAVFLASANPINVDAADYFIEQVLPLILARRPDFRLMLVGDVAGKLKLGNPAVIDMGRVPKVSDAFAAATIAVNPVRMGTGLNIKMVEAFANAMPCVSSASGSRGLEAWRNETYRCVEDNDATAMANEVLRLLNSAQAAAALGASARSWAEQWNVKQVATLAATLPLSSRPANVPADLSLHPA